jgi:hypothetical protein
MLDQISTRCTSLSNTFTVYSEFLLDMARGRRARFWLVTSMDVAPPIRKGNSGSAGFATQKMNLLALTVAALPVAPRVQSDSCPADSIDAGYLQSCRPRRSISQDSRVRWPLGIGFYRSAVR